MLLVGRELQDGCIRLCPNGGRTARLGSHFNPFARYGANPLDAFTSWR